MFDSADNLTGLPGVSQTFDDANQLSSRTPAAGAATTYGYTARGERKTATTSGATDTLSWDGAGRLTGVAPAVGQASSYGVDGSGLRSSVTLGGVTKQWTWNVSSVLSQLLSDGDRWFIYGPGGVPVEQVDRSTSTPSWLHQDALGSTRMLTDVNGAITATFAFTPFGQLAGKTGAGDTPLRFTGQYTDPTGYIYLRARVYDPATGVFLSRDPLALITRDPYGYVAGNPLQNADPAGLTSDVEPYWYLGLDEIPFPGPRPPISPDYRPFEDIVNDLMCGKINAATYQRQLAAYETQASWLLQLQLWTIQQDYLDQQQARNLSDSLAYMARQSGGRCVAGALAGTSAWTVTAAGAGGVGMVAACTTNAGVQAIPDLVGTVKL